MRWELHVAGPARKALNRLRKKDQERLLAALDSMRIDPLGGDIARFKNQPTTWRRRVGNFRIFFDIDPERYLVIVVEIRRRTSSTY